MGWNSRRLSSACWPGCKAQAVDGSRSTTNSGTGCLPGSGIGESPSLSSSLNILKSVLSHPLPALTSASLPACTHILNTRSLQLSTQTFKLTCPSSPLSSQLPCHSRLFTYPLTLTSLLARPHTLTFSPVAPLKLMPKHACFCHSYLASLSSTYLVTLNTGLLHSMSRGC